jgi:hypothetical protein
MASMDARAPKPAAERLGRVEYVVESDRSDAHETWLVMRADTGALPHYAQMGLSVTEGARVVVDASSLRPIGILERGAPPANHPAGFNPYFDPPVVA